MSPEDKVRPFHSKDEARGQETADAVAAVLKHAAARDEATRGKVATKGRNPRWMLPLGINLGVLAMYLLIAPPNWVIVDPIEGPDPAGQEDNLRLAMFLQAKRIEAYVLEHGALPDSLSQAGSAVPGVEYVRQGLSQFQLVGIVGDSTTLLYDSTEPSAEFVGDLTTKLMMGG